MNEGCFEFLLIRIFALRTRGSVINSEIEKGESFGQIFWPGSSTFCFGLVFCSSAALNLLPVYTEARASLREEHLHHVWVSLQMPQDDEYVSYV